MPSRRAFVHRALQRERLTWAIVHGLAYCDQVGATVLVTSGGSRVGQAILELLQGRRSDLRLVAINSRLESAHLQCFDHVICVSEVSSPDFADNFIQVVSRERPHLILAGRDDDVVALAALAAKDLINPRLLSSGRLPLARVLRDTGDAAGWAIARSLPFAPTVPLGVAESKGALMDLTLSWGLPWVVKPACGQGSRDVSVVTRMDDLLAATTREGFVAQPFLQPMDVGDPVLPWSFDEQGWEIDVQVLLGPEAEVRAVGTFVTRMRQGCPVATRVFSDVELDELGRAWGQALSSAGWRGPVNIQVRLSHAGEWLPFEINARLGGGAPLRAREGFDEMSMLVRDFLGVELPQFEPR